MIIEEIMYLKLKHEQQSLMKLFYNAVTEFHIEHNCDKPLFLIKRLSLQQFGFLTLLKCKSCGEITDKIPSIWWLLNLAVRVSDRSLCADYCMGLQRWYMRHLLWNLHHASKVLSTPIYCSCRVHFLDEHPFLHFVE